MGRESNLSSPAPITKKKGSWTEVQVAVPKQLMLQSRNQLSVCMGEVAGKLE